ncbi:MAG: TolC family protein [Bacteroidales bacterium]|nr:TolC family protein [Bacteroidales bacterium]
MKTKINAKTNQMQGDSLKMKLLWLILLFGGFSANAQTWSLQQCIDTALVYNKNLQLGRNSIAMGEQRELEAKAGLIPKIMISADYKYFIDLPYQLMPMSTFSPTAPEGEFKEIQFGVPHNINASLQLGMPLYNPQVYGAIQSTKIASEIYELQYKKTEEQVFFEIANLYYNANILWHQQAFIDSNLVNTSRLLKNLQLLYEAEMLKQSDVTKVELQKAQLLTRRDWVANNLDQVLNALKLAMGVSLTVNIEVDHEILYESGQNYLTHQTVELQLANAQSRFIASELRTLKNSRLPSVSLMGSYSQAGFGYDKKPNDFLKFFPVSFTGLQLSYPLFNGTVTRRKIVQKNIEVQNSNLQIALIEEQNSMLISNAGRRKTVTEQTIINTSRQINIATTVYGQQLLQQKEGTASLTEVLLAHNAVQEAQQDYLSAVIEYLKADLELKKLTGNISLQN